MASFQKRGKTWQYTISRMVNGKSVPIRKGGFATKGEAKAAANEIERKLLKGVAPVLKDVPFDEYFEEWLDLYKTDIGKNTMDRYLDTLGTIKENFSGVPMQKITKKIYQKFLNKYAETHSKETTRKLNTHIRACVRDAIDEGIIHIDFTRKVTISGTVPSKKPGEKHLNYFESKRLLKYLSNKLETSTHYLLLLALTSGLRFGELVGLTEKDFDFKNNILNIDKTWGYTNKMHEGFGPTKNEASVRKIKIDAKTMKLFENWFKNTTKNIHGLVFYSQASKYKVISNGAANKALATALKNLNIENIISVHGCRHTHASILLYKRRSIYYVSERLGHEDIQTTLETYAHILKELREQDDKGTIKTFEAMYA